jgi:predicted site-specific integrase-resolvase
MMKKKNKEKRDLKNFVAYVKYQCGHGVPLDDVLKNLGYVRVGKVS